MYLSELDIGNRALQHVGEPLLNSASEDSRANTEVTFVYDKLRRWELRRNVWRFSIRTAVLRAIDTSTMLLSPDLWDANVTYPPAAIVRDDNGILWQSSIPGNINNDPTTTIAWDRYFGPMTVHQYDEDLSYSAGELVWAEAGNPGGYVIYRSLVNENEDDPETAVAWAAATTYNAGETVSYGGYHWRSLIEVNRNITPAVGPLDFDVDATYSTGQTVTGSDGYIYSSVGNGNLGNDPTTDTAGTYWTNTTVPHAWKRVPTIYASATSWQPLFASMSNLTFTYPIGCGPSQQTNTRNVFHLPAGFLRKTAINPKAGAQSYLGASSNAPYEDYNYEGDFITSGVGPTMAIRFAADITDVRKFDSMFCEGLAARIGFEVCEAVTQSSGKKNAIAGAYQKFMTEARLVNAIEVGSEEPDEDDYLTVRR